MDLILACEVSVQAAQALFQNVPSKEARSLALGKQLGSSASTSSAGSRRTQQPGKHAFTPDAAHQHSLLQDDTKNTWGLCSKEQSQNP